MSFSRTDPVGIVADLPYGGTGHSYQIIAEDLELTPTAGSNNGANPKFLAPGMFNIHSKTTALTSVANYLAGTISAYSIVGAVATRYGAAASQGIIMDGAGKADACYLAVIDGDGGAVNAGAAYGVKQNNSSALAGVDYGLDLFSASHDGYAAFKVIVADIRFNNQAVMTFGTVDPSAGGGVAATINSFYRRTNGAAGELWYKTGAANTSWQKIAG